MLPSLRVLYPVQRVTSWWPAVLGLILFFLLCSLLLPYVGLQEDEMMFAVPIYWPAT